MALAAELAQKDRAIGSKQMRILVDIAVLGVEDECSHALGCADIFTRALQWHQNLAQAGYAVS